VRTRTAVSALPRAAFARIDAYHPRLAAGLLPYAAASQLMRRIARGFPRNAGARHRAPEPYCTILNNIHAKI